MNSHFPSHLAAVIDNNAIVVFAFILMLVAIRTIGRVQRHRHWADIARAAIDKGQPIPPAPPNGDRSWCGGSLGWTRGLIWIAVGVAFCLIHEHDLRDWAPLPICVGVAILMIGLITRFASGGPNNRPPQP